jgi:hypothetical protein
MGIQYWSHDICVEKLRDSLSATDGVKETGMILSFLQQYNFLTSWKNRSQPCSGGGVSSGGSGRTV